MRRTLSVLSALAYTVVANNLTSSKRGLVYIYSGYGSDDDIWDAAGSDLTWYYDYSVSPISTFDHTKMQFVPMLWGTEKDSPDASFYEDVKSLKESGMNVNYVLGFNEPDLCGSGGSCIDVKQAVRIWMKDIEPLKDLSIKLGAPAVTGSSSGLAWLQEFYTLCAGKCTTHFLPIHWYGDFVGLAGYVTQVNALYPNMTLWVTEFAYPNTTLENTQEFYNQSTRFLDDTSFVTHYSYFGSFRSDVSNVGPNAAMLNRNGELTDIGAWYLGENATANLLKSDSPRAFNLDLWIIALGIAALLILV